jgi:membrane peptidoglycan carboxypeptidase
MADAGWRFLTDFLTLRLGEDHSEGTVAKPAAVTRIPEHCRLDGLLARFRQRLESPFPTHSWSHEAAVLLSSLRPFTFVRRFLLRFDVDRRFRYTVTAVCLVLAAAAVESRTSWLQSRVFAAVAKRLYYQVETGADRGPRVAFPNRGPYDRRMGYAEIDRFVERLEASGYTVESQARSSPWLRRITSWGLYPVYLEKNQAGLEILGRGSAALSSEQYPRRVYERFEEIPPVVIQSLLLIENRELLNTQLPFRNPAVEWDRLTMAALMFGLHRLQPGTQVIGGSTLATQLEKLRHSPGGVTSSPADKLRQMSSASLRSYLEGEETLPAQKRIIRDYLNSLPLAAVAGYGEVVGLGDGVEAWFGADFDKMNALLGPPESEFEGDRLVARAQAYRQVLALLLAIKKPSYFLLERRDELKERIDRFLPLVAEQGFISTRVRDLALAADPAFRRGSVSLERLPFSRRKATDAVRADLLDLLGIESTYDLDRLDLAVTTSIDADVQREVAKALDELRDPKRAAEAGLNGHRLLSGSETGDVIYSFTLYERAGDANLLRVQADNLDQPLNVNEGVKLELGSTAKLRTLVHYLEIIAELHRGLAGLSPEQLAAVRVPPNDNLTRWAKNYLQSGADRRLSAMLEAAMGRSYSASPAEGFFTGSGLHHFANFEPEDNGRVMNVRQALQRSVNLVFIRLMRDVVNYHVFRVPGAAPEILADANHPARKRYLDRFAEREGGEFLREFYQRYHGLSRDEALATLLRNAHKTPAGIITAYRSVRPRARAADFVEFLRVHAPDIALAASAVEKAFDEYAIDKFNLGDRGYLARVHPLELWLAARLDHDPAASLPALIQASADVRADVYRWLFETRHKQAQDTRIRILMEADAFTRIHQAWRRVGFPFDSLVPSYATAIGSSGDRPAALAELMGIIVNGGVRLPSVTLKRLHFGEGTPAETVLAPVPAQGKRVLPTEVASLVHRELVGVVENGTGRRAAGGIALSDGTKLAVGGKTGTGDNRFEVYATGGRVIGSRAISRTATFTFVIGDRFFGTITAFVRGQEADAYGFTSALPVQVFKYLTPALKPVLEAAPEEQPENQPDDSLARLSL